MSVFSRKACDKLIAMTGKKGGVLNTSYEDPKVHFPSIFSLHCIVALCIVSFVRCIPKNGSEGDYGLPSLLHSFSQFFQFLYESSLQEH